ncbi:hypothetical protein NDA16_000725 [Ustilago loliicola]|nr:hypothetical protein NDA16_000725 [Ustilago loliicola]
MKTSQIILTSLSVLGVAGIGYALYFDHKRQTDPAFRKSLRKESKKSSKADKKEAAKRAQQEDGFIQDLLQEVRAPGTFPSGVEEREQYFLKYVSLGEQLFAMGTDKYLEAAAAFFKALKVYPQPVELIMIYQKAVPKEVFDTIMRIVSKDIATGGGEGGEGMTAAGLDEVDDDGPSPSAAAASRKAEAEENDEEAEDDDKAEDKEASTSASATTSSTAQPAQQQGTDSGTTSSQEWDTLSATSLNETGVMVTPNAPASTASESPESAATPSAAATAEEEETSAAPSTTEEPKLTSIDTSASVTKEPVSQNFTSGWSPAPVFAGSSPRADKKADPFSSAQDKSE